jgi:methyl-accepting chemotaxis protein
LDSIVVTNLASRIETELKNKRRITMLKKMRLGTKIITGFLTVTAIAAVMGIVGYSGMSRIMTVVHDEIIGKRLPSVQSLLIMIEAQQAVLVGERGLLIRRFMEPEVRKAQYAYIEAALKRAGDAKKVYEPLPQTKEEEKLWKELVPLWEQWKNEHQKVVDLSREKDGLVAGGVALTDPRIADIDETALDASLTARKSFLASRDLLNKITDLNEMYAKEAGKTAGATAASAKLMLIVAIVVAILMSLGLGFFIAKMISIPVKNLAEDAEKIAEGDLNVTVHHDSGDEIGQLADSFRKMVANLRELIGKVSQSSETVASAATQLSAASAQIATGAEELAAQAGTVATASEEMAATSTEIAKNCDMAANESRNANDTALAGATVVDGTITTMLQIAERVKESAKTVEGLGAMSDQIGQIIGTIEDISDQTNLLALNAAIEAARAGEHGRGFAVVADEVRALAERATKATREIGKMINAIQKDTKGAVIAMEERVKEVESGCAEAAKSGEALVEIQDRINAVTAQVSQMATAAEQQTGTTVEITSNIQLITQVVQDTARGAQESASSAEQLAALADELQQLVGQFRLTA